MARRRRLLDCYCCQGGASMGYWRAGFQVYGVDLFRYRDAAGKMVGHSRKRYPFPAHQGDVIAVLLHLLSGGSVIFTHPDGTDEALTLADFDAIAASPPCHIHSAGTRALDRSDYPDLVEPTRELLIRSGLPYVIENVEGAPLLYPLLMCGTMFRMRATDKDGQTLWLRRHRLFESNVWLTPVGMCSHPSGIKCGGVYGAGSTSREAAADRSGGYTPSDRVQRELMGIDWMTRHGLAQSIPPAYTEQIGLQLLEHLELAA